PWSEILNNQQIKTPVKTQRIVRALLKDSDQVLPESTPILFFLQKSHWRYQTFVEKNGLVRLTLPDVYEPDEFFYLAEVEEIITNQIKIEWDSLKIKLPHATVSTEIE